MRAHAYDVLKENLVVRNSHARVIARELQPHAAELARAPVDHERISLRAVAAEDRKIGRGERTGVDQADTRGARVQAVVAVTDAPFGHELIDALRVPTRLPRAIAGSLRAERRSLR